MNGVVGTSGLGRAINLASAALFAGAAACSALLLASPSVAVAVAAVAFLVAHGALARIDRRPDLSIAAFVPRDLDMEPDELVLTELAELLLTETVAASEGELLLVDALVQPRRDSSVIRLFDPSSLATAGDPRGRIESRIDAPSRDYPDATSEFHQALAALKNSLR